MVEAPTFYRKVSKNNKLKWVITCDPVARVYGEMVAKKLSDNGEVLEIHERKSEIIFLV